MLRNRCALAKLGVLAASMFAACSDDATNPETPASLAISPKTLQLSDASPNAVLSITTSPSGGRLSWSVSAKPDWITVAPASGTIDGDVVEVTVSAMGLDTLPPSKLSGTLGFVSDGGTAEVAVHATIDTRITVGTEPAVVEFAETKDTAVFVVRNTGNVMTSWAIAENSGRLKFTPRNGFLLVGGSAVVTAAVNRNGLAAGTTDLVAFLEAGWNSTQLLVRIQTPAVPKITVTPTVLRMVGAGAVDSFTITNAGTAPLTWSATPAAAWLELSPTSGEVAPGGRTVVTVSVDENALPGAEAETSITITSNASDDPIILAAGVKPTGGWAPGFYELDHRVVDAEYSRASDLLVTVSADPARLNIVDPKLGTVHSVSLAHTPTAVSVAPSGRYAAVGHNGYVSYVDLGARSVVRVYRVTIIAADVVLADNGWVYVFPPYGGWGRIHCIELATGVETTSDGNPILAGTVARLHPSGDFIYGATPGPDIQKYDIRVGTATILHDAPNQSDYPIGGDLWLSDDGTRIFVQFGTVLSSAPARQVDMIYAGRLQGLTSTAWIEHSSAAGRIYALARYVWTDAPALDIRIYEAGSLNFLGNERLPKFTDSSTPAEYDAHGRFLFVDSSGKRLYVLVQADPEAGLAADWAMVVMNAEDLP